MNTIKRITVIATMLVMISFAGFSQRTCSIKIKNVGTSVPPYSVVILNLVEPALAPSLIEAHSVPVPIYTGVDNDFQFNTQYYPPIPTLPILRYVVRVTDGSTPSQVVDASSILFSPANYMSNDIPVEINF